MTKNLIIAALFIASAPCLTSVALAGGEGTSSLALSLDGSADRYGGTREGSLRAGLEFGDSELKLGTSALDWSLELYYSYSRSDADGAVTRAGSIGLDAAKIMLSRWRGKDLEAVKPYLLAGAELTWLKEPDEEEGGSVSSRYVSPTAGCGLEFKLNRRVSLNAEYRQNFSGGSRRISGVTLGLTWTLLGAQED